MRAEVRKRVMLSSQDSLLGCVSIFIIKMAICKLIVYLNMLNITMPIENPHSLRELALIHARILFDVYFGPSVYSRTGSLV